MRDFWCSVCYLALINICLLVLGYVLLKNRIVWQSWVLLALGLLTGYLIFQSASAVWKMTGLITTAFMGMKVVVATKSYQERTMGVSFLQWLCYSFLWAGMRPQPFEELGKPSLSSAWCMIRFGLSRITAGILLVVLSVLLFHHFQGSWLRYACVVAILLAGLSLILHFGFLSIVAGIWRLFGVPVFYLFKSPAKSFSVTEFWSKRWNIAFSEMTSIAIFRPLKPILGAGGALTAAFLFSGLLHELALSVPVNGGYGLPLLYFLIQGAVVWIEKIKKISGRLWTSAWIILPLPLLFHSHFIRGILLPILKLDFLDIGLIVKL